MLKASNIQPSEGFSNVKKKTAIMSPKTEAESGIATIKTQTFPLPNVPPAVMHIISFFFSFFH